MDYYPWLKNQQEQREPTHRKDLGTQQTGGPMILRGVDAEPMDLGSQVGARRNLEFSAGQRSHRISTGSYTRA